MRFAEEACETLEAAILAGFPVQLVSAEQAGATSLVTIAGWHQSRATGNATYRQPAGKFCPSLIRILRSNT